MVMMPGSATERLRLLVVAGVTGALFLAVLGWFGGSYLGIVTSDQRAVARLTTTGDSLGVASDVKFRGLRVGRVLAVEAGEQPKADIVVMAEHADQIPEDVVARVLPSTLFGNEYVELVSASDARRAGALPDDAVIAADTSGRTARLMDVLADTQRVLVAVDPERLDAAISAISDALRGKGDDLARLTRDADALLADWARLDPTLARDLTLLADNVETLADIEPQLVSTVEDLVPVATTIARQRADLRAAMTQGTDLLAAVNDFAEEHGQTMLGVLGSTAATLDAFATGAGPFADIIRLAVGVARNGATSIEGNRIQMEAAITNDLLRPYTREDCPRYGAMAGPNCGGGR